MISGQLILGLFLTGVGAGALTPGERYQAARGLETGSAAGPDVAAMVLLAAGALCVVCAVVFLVRTRRRNNSADRFEKLCEQHGLSRSQRRFLAEAAEKAELGRADRIFTEPEALQQGAAAIVHQALVSGGDRRQRQQLAERVASVRSKLGFTAGQETEGLADEARGREQVRSSRRVNRRRFLRVPVRGRAHIAAFPFRAANADAPPAPRFTAAELTELAAGGVRVESGVRLSVGQRVLVVGGPAGGKAFQDVGRVRRVEKRGRRYIAAIELVGLGEPQIAALVRETNAAAIRSRKALQEMLSPAGGRGEPVAAKAQ